MPKRQRHAREHGGGQTTTILNHHHFIRIWYHTRKTGQRSNASAQRRCSPGAAALNLGNATPD
jgi:hypothetical protein